MEELLSSAIILVACISAGVSCMFIARSRSSINKHSRQRIKDFESDIKYLADSKKEEAKEYRQEILRLKSSVNRLKDGPIVTDTDMKNSGLGEVLMQLIPNKYKAIGNYVVPMIEEKIKNDPTLVDKFYEKIKSANNKPSEPGSEVKATATL